MKMDVSKGRKEETAHGVVILPVLTSLCTV
jgi:hypothetical protein